MSTTLGIIAEYDPLHKGHEYHLKEALEKSGADISVAVISGYFTQRGEPAIVDKWARAEMALKAGFDLVVEMPFIFACNNAGYFAQSGVGILEALGADYIAFGSETADVEALLEAADARRNLSPEQLEEIKGLVKEGVSYPRALTMVLGEEGAYGPNDSLAVEYLRHMETAKPLPILRKGAGHGDLLEEEGFASATFIRKDLLRYGSVDRVRKLIPEYTAEILERERSASGGFADPEAVLPYLQARAASMDVSELNGIYGAEEGLGSILKDDFRYADSLEKLIGSLKSKRYT
ncbi:MAG: nucleotidyltransferase family protein, partial [Firmicutes bacterium]|nr:nucleotidyltransferase family protein [Bacillota bacterium]